MKDVKSAACWRHHFWLTSLYAVLDFFQKYLNFIVYLFLWSIVDGFSPMTFPLLSPGGLRRIQMESASGGMNETTGGCLDFVQQKSVKVALKSVKTIASRIKNSIWLLSYRRDQNISSTPVHSASVLQMEVPRCVIRWIFNWTDAITSWSHVCLFLESI